MIFFSGDIHGKIEVNKVVQFFEHKEINQSLLKDNYLIILGDVAVCWDNGPKDHYVREKLASLPVTVLWIDGNHENFDIIDNLPVTEWNGGKVQFISNKIIHLMRGYIYNIDGKSLFAFGGGFSIDKMFRREGINWWSREMPSKEEYLRGIENLKRVHYKVDYVITHTVPGWIARRLVTTVLPGEEELQEYFDELSARIQYKKWYFGHWHMDRELFDFIGIYNNIVELS